MTAEPERFTALAITDWCRPLLFLVAGVSLTVLVGGWVAGIDALVRIWPGFAAMVPSTALLFAANSTALLYPRTATGRAGFLLAVALFSLAAAIIDIAAILLGVTGGIDALISSAFGLGGLGEDCMAPATALCFLLLAIALLTSAGKGRFEPVFVVAATGGLLLSLSDVAGYIFGVAALYSVPLFAAMALHTSLSFVILFTAVLFARPRRGWVRTLTGRGEGSAGARRLMPLVFGVPLMLCFLVLEGTRAHLFDPEFGLSLLAVLIVVLLSASVLRNAGVQNRMQQQIAERLQQLSDDNEFLLQEVYHRVKNNLQQINALIMFEARTMPEGQREALHALSNRIFALSSAYELLLSSRSVSRLDLSPFLEDLCRSICSGSGAEKRNIRWRVACEHRPVKVDAAVSIGLLVNELVTNALKHAFTGREKGMITISVHRADDETLRLSVQDDGRGMERGEARNRRTAGSRIVNGLIRQLDGSMRVSGKKGQGTLIEVTIPTGALD